MATNLNVQVSGASLQIIDNTGNVQRVNSPLSTLTAQVTASFYEPYLQIGVGNTSLTLPATTIWVAYVRNLSGANNVTVTCTPAGGAAWVNGIILVPTAVFMYWAAFSSNPAAGGVTAITLTASGANTPVEVMLAG